MTWPCMLDWAHKIDLANKGSWGNERLIRMAQGMTLVSGALSGPQTGPMPVIHTTGSKIECQCTMWRRLFDRICPWTLLYIHLSSLFLEVFTWHTWSFYFIIFSQLKHPRIHFLSSLALVWIQPHSNKISCINESRIWPHQYKKGFKTTENCKKVSCFQL